MPDGNKDRSSRRASEQMLDDQAVQTFESRLQLGRLLEACQEEIFVFRADTLRFLIVNKGARRNLGYAMAELKGMTPLDIKPGMDAATLGAILKTLTSGEEETVQFETQHQRKDGSTYLADVHLQYFGQEKPAVFLATIVDMTERHAIEAEMRQAQREAEEANRIKSEFLASVSHELRTPLNAVIGFSELLLSDVGGTFGPDRVQAYLADIRDAGRHQLALIGDILDFAKMDAGHLSLKREKIRINDIFRALERLEERNAAERGITLSFGDAPPDLWVMGDELRIRQIVLNLIDNALKFTPEGGLVTVQASPVARGGTVIEVQDTGTGISLADQQEVFKPFAQLAQATRMAAGGTGLGLALVKRLVELQGGWVRLKSKPGEGTRVSFWLPGSDCSHFDI
ncbi:MAG: PAS domain-containing sensor histidine kinase [Magnetovibrionaceae bacterium]